MNGRRGLVALGLVLFAVLAAVGVQLHAAQSERVRAAERRFEQRAQISAALTQSVFGALGSISGKQMASRYGGSPAALRSELAEKVERNAESSEGIAPGYSAILGFRPQVRVRQR